MYQVDSSSSNVVIYWTITGTHVVPDRQQYREIKALRSHNDDTGSYDTLYQVDSSSSDVVIYWTMTGPNVVPDRQ